MKKGIALCLTVIMVFLSTVSVLALNRATIDSMIERLASYTEQERNALIANLAVFSGGETNLEMACEQIDQQSGSLYDLAKPLIDQAGAEAVKALIRSIAVFGCANVQNSLYAYVDAKTKPEPIALSDKAEAGMELLIDVFAEANPTLGELLETDGINASVMGYMFKNLLQNVKEEELFLYDEESASFSVNSMSTTFIRDLNELWDGIELGGESVDAENLMESMVVLLNTYVNASQGKVLAQGFEEFGMCKIKTPRPTGGSGGGTGGGGGTGTVPSGSVGTGTLTPSQTEEEIVYEQVESAEGLTEDLLENGVIIKIGVSAGDSGEVDVTKTFDKSALLNFDLSGQNLMMYRFENGALTPVKYTAQTDSGFSALLDRGGYYVVKDMAFVFGDVSGWAQPYIEGLYVRGIISGKGDGVFMPEERITREEFVKLVVELFGLNDPNAQAEFSDVDPNAWYYSYVATAAAKNIVSGIGDGQFGVGQNIKRQDMAKIIQSVLLSQGVEGTPATADVFADYETISEYARDSVLTVYQLGIVSGDDNRNFNPNQFATRQEAAKMIYGMMTVYLQNAGQ